MFVDSGVPYFDADEEGSLVRHRLTEVEPGLFLAENGETLDLRASPPTWRSLDLRPRVRRTRGVAMGAAGGRRDGGRGMARGRDRDRRAAASARADIAAGIGGKTGLEPAAPVPSGP